MADHPSKAAFGRHLRMTVSNRAVGIGIDIATVRYVSKAVTSRDSRQFRCVLAHQHEIAAAGSGAQFGALQHESGQAVCFDRSRDDRGNAPIGAKAWPTRLF